MEICRNDKENSNNSNYVSIIGLTRNYIHLTVARHVGIGELQFMYRPVSFLNIPRSADRLDFVSIPSTSGGACRYNEVYNFDGYEPEKYTKSAMGEFYDEICSGMGIIFCNNENVDYINVELYLNNCIGSQIYEFKYSHIEKNDSGIYPIRFLFGFDDRIYIDGGDYLIEPYYGSKSLNYAYRNYYGYLANYFSSKPDVIVKGYDKSGKLVIEKSFND